MSGFIVTKEWVEANASLVTMKESSNYPGLYVLRYKNRVFYDNLWTPELEQCRGTVVDKDFNVIVRPFDKIYNPHEVAEDFIKPHEYVWAARKVNGFMCGVTYSEEYGLIVSTTGSLDSDYVEIAHKHISEISAPFFSFGGVSITYLFEICDASDPHIIKENEGAYLIGAVVTETGNHLSEQYLNDFGHLYKIKRHMAYITQYKNVVEQTKHCKHEGFVVRLVSNPSVKLKLKSRYYLYTKMVARMRKDKLMWNLSDGYAMKQKVDEEYYPLVDYLIENRVEFAALDEQARITFVENYFKEAGNVRQ
jgi:hypothetical protein